MQKGNERVAPAGRMDRTDETYHKERNNSDIMIRLTQRMVRAGLVTTAGLVGMTSMLLGVTAAYACSAVVQGCCDNAKIVGGLIQGTTTIEGASANIDSWNPSPVWLHSSEWVLTASHQRDANGLDQYAQVGEMHMGNPSDPLAGPNAFIFYEYLPDSAPDSSFYIRDIVPGTGTPTGNIYYSVARNYANNGVIFEANSAVMGVNAGVSFSADTAESMAEIRNYESVSGVEHGDAGMGNKSNHVYTNSFAWIDTGGNAHYPNLNNNTPNERYYNNSNNGGTGYQKTAAFQSFASSNGNNWSSWDNRCG